MTTETSKQAFIEIQSKLPECRMKVFNALQTLEYATNSMIADFLGWSINRITPRTNELRKMGLIEISHISWCPVTKSRAQYLKLNRNI